MEKLATIEVYLANKEGPSSSNFDFETRKGQVVLRPSNDNFPIRSKSDLADVFAHELGHMIGSILRLPVQMDSLRDNFMHNFAGTPVTTNLYNGEVLAWDLAGKMRKIDPRNREPRLQSYREGMEE